MLPPDTLVPPESVSLGPEDLVAFLKGDILFEVRSGQSDLKHGMGGTQGCGETGRRWPGGREAPC